jgi:hypothetical protein
MAQDTSSVESILALDCGSTSTRALLIERVDGEYRFVAQGIAPSTTGPPWNDMMTSVRSALVGLSGVVNRRLLDQDDEIVSPERAGSGTDAIVGVVSIGEPLHLVLFGGTPDVSLDGAQRALSATNSVVQGFVSPDGRDGGVRTDDIEGQIRLFEESAPDAIVIMASTDGGAQQAVLQAAEAAVLSSSALPQDLRPPIVYAGNAELQPQVVEIAGSDTELRIVGNVRPSLDVADLGPLQTEIESLHHLKSVEQLPGYRTLAAWSKEKVLPASTSFAHTVQYIAHVDGVNVLAIDVGGARTTVASVLDEQPDLVIRNDLGLSHSIAQLLALVPVESIARWLPFEMDEADISNALRNKALYRHTLPQTRQDLLLEQAVAREAIRLALADIAPRWPPTSPGTQDGLLPKFHLIVGCGGVLTGAPASGQAALILLDALQPVGLSGLALDQVGLVTPMGAVAMVNPLAAVEVMERDGLLNLGTVVAPLGRAREGELALTCKLEYSDGRVVETDVLHGSLEVIPLQTGQSATLQLRPSRDVDVGLGVKGQAAMTTVRGGAVGLIIDARGRPLPMAGEPAQRREQARRWLQAMGS